jgi:Stage II sporulation protein
VRDEMRNTITRGRFLAGAAATTAALVTPRIARSRDAAPPSVTSIRVKLFTGSVLARAELTGTVPLTVSAGGQTRTFAAVAFDAASGQLTGDGAIVAAGSAPVLVTATAPIGVNAFGASGSLGVRHYNGSIALARVSQNLLLVNTVDMESYVASTMASEISPGWATESLKAQAIVTRT